MGVVGWLFPGRDADDAPSLEARLERYDRQERDLEERLEAGPPDELREARRRVARYVAAGEEPPADLLAERDRLEALHGRETLEAAIGELRAERAELERKLAQKRKAEGEREAPAAAEAVVRRGRELVAALLEVHGAEWARYRAARDRYAAACRKARDATRRLHNDFQEGDGRADLPGNLDRRLRREAPSVKAAEALMERIRRS